MPLADATTTVTSLDPIACDACGRLVPVPTRIGPGSPCACGRAVRLAGFALVRSGESDRAAADAADAAERARIDASHARVPADPNEPPPPPPTPPGPEPTVALGSAATGASSVSAGAR